MGLAVQANVYYPCATVLSPAPLGLRTAVRPHNRAGGATALSVDGVVCPAGPSAPGPVEWARQRRCNPSPHGARPVASPPPVWPDVG
jgi:hypothetical protein